MIGQEAERIRAFAEDAVSPERLPAGATRLVAVGWATVESDRAVLHLADALGIPAAAFVAASGSAALGASCRVVAPPIFDDLLLAVVEPATEGRLAAALARWDEGPVAAWYATSVPFGDSAPGVVGPFGQERLAGGDPLTGPHRLVIVTGTGTISA